MRQKGLRLLEQGALRLDIPDRHRAVADELTKLEKEDFFGALIFEYRDGALLTGHPEDPDLRTNRTDCRLCAGAIYEYGRGVPPFRWKRRWNAMPPAATRTGKHFCKSCRRAKRDRHRKSEGKPACATPRSAATSFPKRKNMLYWCSGILRRCDLQKRTYDSEEAIPMAWLTLGLFCAGLLLCLALDLSVLYALTGGLVLFVLYGKYKGFGWRDLFRMVLDGVRTVKNILITFVLIGMLTAFWRAAGTIPVIVAYASALIRPSVFLLMTFLLNSMVSALMGTSFGTAATMGVVCATMGTAMGVDMRLIGGAILSGVFFGDRCSPVSTSALLVAEVTGTKLFDNIRRMVRTALVPFLLAAVLYGALGLLTPHSGEGMDLKALFGQEFALHPLALLPAAAVLILSALRVKVKLTMGVSILAAIPLCILLQKTAPETLLRLALTGYQASDPQVAAMLNGGGIVSMFKVMGIVCLSSAYSGIFRKTGLLDGARHAIEALAKKTSSFAAILCTSVISVMVSCNQTLAVLLTDQLCASLNQDAGQFALDLEDSVIIVAPLIPWCIAGAVPLATVGADSAAIPLAFYLYLLPLWRLVTAKRDIPTEHK